MKRDYGDWTWPERRAGEVLFWAGAGIFVAAVVMGAVGREATAVALVSAGLVVLLASAFASRVVKAGKEGVTLIPLPRLLEAADELERERPGDKDVVELFRETVLQLKSSPDAEASVDRAVDAASKSVETEDKLAAKAVEQLQSDGWTIERQPLLGDSLRPDFVARRDGEVLVGEVKASRDSLSPALPDRFDEMRSALLSREHGSPTIRPLLVLGAARGRPTLIERDVERDGWVMKINPSKLE